MKTDSMNADLLDWLRERQQNCERLAALRGGDDAAGWREDGSYFKRAVAALTGAQPAAPSERAENWREAAMAFEHRAMRVEAALRLALKELSDVSRSGYVTRAMDVLRAEAAPAAQPADSAMTAEQIEALAHRTAWRYVHGSSNPNDSASSEYTFNRAQLLEFARALVAKETPHAR